MKLINVRLVTLTCFFICCSLLAFAYYLEHALNLQPCPLCILERLVFGLVALVFVCAAIQNPSFTGQKVYGGFIIVLAILGMMLAGRHLWLQGQPSALGEICVPGVSYLLKSLPLTQALKTMLLGSSDCSKVEWIFLGLSIPGWTFLSFDVFALIGLGLMQGLFQRFHTQQQALSS